MSKVTNIGTKSSEKPQRKAVCAGCGATKDYDMATEGGHTPVYWSMVPINGVTHELCGHCLAYNRFDVVKAKLMKGGAA